MPFRLPNCWRSIRRSWFGLNGAGLISEATANRRTRRPVVQVLMLLVLLSGCHSGNGPSEATTTEKPVVLTTSIPLLEMATLVVGDAADVRSALPASAISRLWKPTPDDIRTMQNARLLLINGAGYEPWRTRVSLPLSRVTDTATAYTEQLIQVPDAVMHQHGPGGQHSHPGTIWATWLDPELAISQLKQVQQACIRLFPDQEAALSTRAMLLQRDLQAVDEQLNALRDSLKVDGSAVLGDGPHFLYLARRLGWKLDYLHWPEAGTPLTETQQQELRDRASKHAGGLFLMRHDRDISVRRLAESIGLRVVEVDVCERLSDTGRTVSKRMKSNLDQLRAAIEQTGPAG